MIITTMGIEKISSISLPDRAKGRYWLCEGAGEPLLAIEGINETWAVKSTWRVKVLGADGTVLDGETIEPNKVYRLKKKDGSTYSVFTEPVTDDRQIYTKYTVTEGEILSIGRAPGNDICFDKNVVSTRHAEMLRQDGRWYIRDLDSTNGVFVNEEKIREQELYPGDCIFIMGLKILVGSDFIACNNPDEQVRVSSKLQPMMLRMDGRPREMQEILPPKYFYRSPRFKRDVETAVFKIDSPPASPITEELPWILMMGPSLAMGMMSVATLITALITFNIMSIIMGIGMLTATLLLPTITKKYEKRRKIKKEQLRQEKYRAYLQEIRGKIQAASRLQEEILNENGVSIQECEERIRRQSRNLWERGPGHNDFLQVRLGNGTGILDASIQYSERRFTLEEDPLLEEQYELCEKEKLLHNIPVTYSLYDNPVSGIIGPQEKVVQFAQGLIIQLAALYSYDEVKFVFLCDEKQSEMHFVKWLPHVWSEDRKFRFLATTNAEVREVSAWFEKKIEARKQMSDNDLEHETPYYIIFAMNKELALRAEFIKNVLASSRNLHISVLAFYDQLQDLPKECSMVVELDGINGRLFDKDDISARGIGFTPDIQPGCNPMELSVCLANTFLDNAEDQFKLPTVVPFLEMLGVGKVEHLNALRRWKEHDPTKSLSAAVGMDTYGGTFALDLHEKFHGPHGLVAGMTGSGKSEFIITYILSLAVNYHPDEVAFILIDYKGGGTAEAFEKLPHTAGIITNLDGSAIKRSLVSVESELKRRQTIFSKVSKMVGVSNIDIYKYQKLHREGVVEEPLPHLFIIADEFAELKTQQPEFMTQLVSAARIGRSLGIHLILATQKPSGVVDDQIWSNSRFRVCLKVQERSDSMDMLKRPDAAELTNIGRFYLQVGYNEMFELGQSAWSGAPYYPADQVVQERDDSVSVIDNNGHVVRMVRPDHAKLRDQKAGKQLDAVVNYLRDIAEEEKICVRRLWLEPIPAVVLLRQIWEKAEITVQPFVLEPVVGVYDDPAHQRQDVLRLPISSGGNVILYGSTGSGKSRFLDTLVYSLLWEHSPDEVNLYLLDFASETLKAFTEAPQVGDVVLAYETEKINNLFKMLAGEISQRRRQFASCGGDYDSFIRISGRTMPAIVTVVDNFSAFAELYPEKVDELTVLTREGTKYGIYFVLTAVGPGAVRLRLQQNFAQVLTLQLNDSADYASVVGKTDGLFPARYTGRGLVCREELYEFQTASLTDGPESYHMIQEYCREISGEWDGSRAARIPILPDVVDSLFMHPYINRNEALRVPVGVEKSSLQVHYYPFDKTYMTMVMSQGTEYAGFISELLHLLGQTESVSGIVFDPLGFLELPMEEEPVEQFQICRTADDCAAQAETLYQLALRRNQECWEAKQQGREPEAYEPVLVVICSLAALAEMLTEEQLGMLEAVFEKGSLDYGIRVILAEQSKKVDRFSSRKWYKERINEDSGIWIGQGILEQYHMNPAKRSGELQETLSAEYGYALYTGKCVRLKLLHRAKEAPQNG